MNRKKLKNKEIKSLSKDKTLLTIIMMEKLIKVIRHKLTQLKMPSIQRKMLVTEPVIIYTMIIMMIMMMIMMMIITMIKIIKEEITVEKMKKV